MSKFLSNSDAGGSGVASPEDLLDDILTPDDDALDTEDKDDKETKDDKDDKAKDKDKDKDIDDEIELKEDKENDDTIDAEDIKIDTPPRKKELLKAYPDLLKKFPYIEKMMYRDKQYQELFGSFDDAKDASEKADVLDGFEKNLLSGSTEELFGRIKESDPKAFDKVVDNLMPTLFKIDKEAYYGIASDMVKRVIVRMVTEGKRINNEQLQDAAALVNQFVFGSSEFEPPKDRTKPAQDDELETERAKFQSERLEAAIEEVGTRVTNTIKNTVTEYIDPKGEMTAYEKKNAIADALRIIDEEIDGDKSFKQQLDKLWKASIGDKLSQKSKDRVRAVWLGKAKTLLKTAITKARAEALKDRKGSRKSSDDTESDNRSRRPIPTGHSAPSRSGKLERKPGESAMDFLMRD